MGVGLAPLIPILLGPVYKWDPDSVRDLLLIAKEPVQHLRQRRLVFCINGGGLPPRWPLGHLLEEVEVTLSDLDRLRDGLRLQR